MFFPRTLVNQADRLGAAARSLQRSLTSLVVGDDGRGSAPTGLRRCADLSLWLCLGYLALACAWLLPGHFRPWPGFRQEVVAAVAFTVLAGATLVGSESVIWPRMALIAIAVACLPMLQIAAGQIDFPGAAMLSSAYVAAFATCICMGASLAHSKLRQQALDGLAACVVFAGIASSGMAFCQWLGPSVWTSFLDPYDGPRPVANIGQPNHLSTQLLLGVAGTLYWYERETIRGWCAALATAWLAWGVALTESRTSWVCIAAIVLWWWLMRRRAKLRLQGMPIAFAVVVFALTVLFLSDIHSLLGAGSRAAEIDAPRVRLKAGTRPLHWAMLVDALSRSPWWGYGWSQVANAQFAASADHPSTGEWLSQSHNLVLDLMVYNGVPLGLLLSAVLLYWFVRRTLACDNVNSWFLLLGLSTLFAHALLENPLHFAYFLLPAGLLMGLASGLERSHRPIHASRLMLAVLASLLMVPLGVVSSEYWKAEDRLRELNLASLGVGVPPSTLPHDDWYLVDGYAAYVRVSTITIKTGMSPGDISEMRKVVSRYPYPNIVMRYAIASALNGNSVAAHDTLVHGCKVYGEVTCDRMRVEWRDLQGIHPGMRAVSFPAWSG